ncbi:MAG: GntR family transcriptional regulator [Alphaproteobacteria bacterium]|nr:GntR family transcriptional regulator [Alphaproteobacteria bacterium]
MVGNPKKIRRVTLADESFNLLKQRIISGFYKPDHALRQDELAKELGVSRIPLREALLKLEADGLIDIVAHKGGIVRALSFDKAQELFDLRILIECDLIAKSIPKMTAENFANAQVALKEFDKIVLNEDNIEGWTELNWQFHYKLYEAAQREETIKILKSLHSNCDRYIRKQLLVAGAGNRAHKQHMKLLQYCKAGDVSSAVAELKNHISEVFKELGEFV